MHVQAVSHVEWVSRSALHFCMFAHVACSSEWQQSGSFLQRPHASHADETGDLISCLKMAAMAIWGILDGCLHLRRSHFVLRLTQLVQGLCGQLNVNVECHISA